MPRVDSSFGTIYLSICIHTNMLCQENLCIIFDGPLDLAFFFSSLIIERENRKGSSVGKSKSQAKLDLHGRKVDEVFDLVDQFLTRNSHKPRVQIIPGKGTGAVKKELLRYLKLGGYPWEYEQLANGSRNTGSLIIILND